MKPQAQSGVQLPYKRSDASAAVDGSLVWDASAGEVQVSDGGAFVPVGSSGVATLPESYGTLQADYTLSNVATAQKLFNWSANGAVTLVTGVYEWDAVFTVTGLSATSGNALFSFGGTAGLARMQHTVIGVDTSSAGTPTATSQRRGSAANAIQLAVPGTGTSLVAYLAGTLDVTVAGTLIPQITLDTAVGTATVETGSRFRIRRMGPSTTATGGTWS